ncbi:MAG: ABC transporter ATP-binding protein [Anaerolineae bacterium]|jgi:subfamily B ATP-binding cassette protein MsbA
MLGDQRGRWARWRAELRGGLQSYGRMLGYVRSYWPYLVLAAICLVCVSLLGLAMPWAVQELVDVIVVEQDPAQISRIALILAVLFGLRALFGVAQTFLVAWVGERVVANLRRQVFDHILSLSLSFFARQRVGAIVSRLGSDVQVIQAAVTQYLVQWVQQVITAAGVIVIMAAVNWRLALLTALAVPGMVLVTRVMGRYMRLISRDFQDSMADASAVVEEALGGIRIVKSFAREEYEGARYGRQVDALFDTAMYRTRVYALLGPLISFFVYGSLVLVLWYGGREVLSGRLSPGQLVAFLMYAVMLSGPLSGFASLYGQLQRALGATERVFELLDTRSEVQEAPDARHLASIRGHVVFDDVSFDYDPRQPVLCHIRLEARPGEVLALVGPSGVGKTTLVNLIPRFYDVSAGRILVDGQDIRGVTLRSLRDQIGIVPQEPALFGGTVAENIRYGRLDASQQEIESAARAANAHDFIVQELPEGYDSPVGERGIKLSGGQRQRIAIARAILKDPSILILDEATSSLDTESEKLVHEALERLMRRHLASGSGRTTFVIAHRLSTITNADRILVLHEGRVVEQGTHAELLARPDSLYRRYHALQFQWGAESLSPDDGEELGQDEPEAARPDLSWPVLPSSSLPSTLSGQAEESDPGS